MCIGGRKETVTHPHRQIRQGQLADGHDVIFAVIQFIHDAFVSGQLFGSPPDLGNTVCGSP